MGYSWAMDEFKCIQNENPDIICGANVSSTPIDNIPSIGDKDLWEYWKCDDKQNQCDKDVYKIPASSCGYNELTLPTNDGTKKTYWTNIKGCQDKEINNQKTNPSPTRNGGTILVTFEDIEFLNS